MNNNTKAFKHKKKGLQYQSILFRSEGWIKYLCRSIVIVLILLILASLVFGPVMLDCFIIYCTITMGSIFIWGGIMHLLLLYHMIYSNYYSYYEDSGKDTFSNRKKVTFGNYFIATMVIIHSFLIMTVLLIGGTGVLICGISKIFGIVSAFFHES
jgi:hypothetical protein